MRPARCFLPGLLAAAFMVVISHRVGANMDRELKGVQMEFDGDMRGVDNAAQDDPFEHDAFDMPPPVEIETDIGHVPEPLPQAGGTDAKPEGTKPDLARTYYEDPSQEENKGALAAFWAWFGNTFMPEKPPEMKLETGEEENDSGGGTSIMDQMDTSGQFPGADTPKPASGSQAGTNQGNSESPSGSIIDQVESVNPID